MTGYYETVEYDGRAFDMYIPGPGIQAFEDFLGRIIASRPCDGCLAPLANTVIAHRDKRLYHPECAPAWPLSAPSLPL